MTLHDAIARIEFAGYAVGPGWTLNRKWIAAIQIDLAAADDMLRVGAFENALDRMEDADLRARLGRARVEMDDHKAGVWWLMYGAT